MSSGGDQLASQSGPGAVPGGSGHLEEIEIKLRVASEELEAIANSSRFATAPLRTAILRSIYYDTAGGDLQESGITLRLREVEGEPLILCLKAVGKTFARTEIEVKALSWVPDIGLFDLQTAQALNEIIAGQPLHPRFETQVSRRKAIISRGNSQIEVALDTGRILSANHQSEISEVELELLSGDEWDLHGLAIDFVREFQVSLDFTSKSEKGFSLLTKTKPEPRFAPPLNLRRKASLEQAIREVSENTLAHFTGNWHAFRADGHPGSIHQMRVALRRMRSAYAMFRHAIAIPELESLRAEAKFIAAALGPARECDVLHDAMLNGPLATGARPKGSEKLLAMVAERRAAAYETARQAIDGKRATLFVLNLWSFLARHPWRQIPQDSATNATEVAASKFASKTLERLFARAVKCGRGLPAISKDDRHRLRIALKNMRYAMEFFGRLLARERTVRQFLKRAELLQDVMGVQNDIAVASQSLAELTNSSTANVRIAFGYVLGWDACHAALMEKSLLKHWKKFVRTKPFWN